MNRRGSIGGVTVGDGWLRNNPDLDYPEGHEFMSDEELKQVVSKPEIDWDDLREGGMARGELLVVTAGTRLKTIEACMPTQAEIALNRMLNRDSGIHPVPINVYQPKKRSKD